MKQERSKTIQVILMDGLDSNKRVYCKMPPSNAEVYKIPRSMLNDCKGDDSFNKTGTYLLFGHEDWQEKDVVYVGQADLRENGEGLLARILDHTKDENENYWNEAIAISTTDNSLTATDINYLERRLYELSTEANRYDLKNKKPPHYGNQDKNNEDKIEDFIDYIRILIGILGYKVFEPYEIVKDSNGESDLEFICDKKDGSVRGVGVLTTDGGILLKKGSVISQTISKSCLSHTRKRRELEKEKISGNKLTEDIYFDAPSTAANFVLGGNVNGWIKWVTNDSRHLTLKEFKEQNNII